MDIPATISGTSREQRQFPTKDDAQRYASERHIEITRFGHAAFALTARQRDDAARAIEILKRHNLTLEQAAKLLAMHVPVAKEPLSLTELRSRFLAAPGRRKAKIVQRRPLSVHNLAWRTARFEKAFGKSIASEIRTEEIRVWLATLGKLSPVSLNNYRRALHAMFAFAASEGYCIANPVAKIPLFDVPEKSPSILTVEQAESLVRCAATSNPKLGLLGFITLGLFAGLRRAEIERLDWFALKRERRMVTVDGSIAKSGSIRNVSLTENALVWLNLCSATSGRVAPPNLNYRLRRLRVLAGIHTWDGNELRHSFASYHFDLHQNGPLTSAQLGHTSGCQLLFQHYRSLVQPGEGLRFFQIRP